MKVDNAVILAAGTASRFAPISYERHKSLVTVRGEVLIERQIRQLREAHISEIIIVTGYKSEQFEYLKDKYNVILVNNDEYLSRNNHSSIYAVKDYLKNTYICSSDNYFNSNPFKSEEDCSFYSSVYVEGKTNEWCIKTKNDDIIDVHVGGRDSWVMLGHVFWDENFSAKFLEILLREYDNPETRDKLWESIYINHIDELKMKIRKYPEDFIFEFDTLDELRLFDTDYCNNSNSNILKNIARELAISESEIKEICAIKGDNNEAVGFTFECDGKYRYTYDTEKMERL